MLHLPSKVSSTILRGSLASATVSRVPSALNWAFQPLISTSATSWFLAQDPVLRLGAKGASEVKVHPFFKGIDWENLALQKAAFIPQPESSDDTSYFVSRHPHSSYQIKKYGSSCDFTSTVCNSNLDIDLESSVGEENIKEFDSQAIIDLASLNFSFKNLSQLVSMNFDVLVQSAKVSKGPSG